MSGFAMHLQSATQYERVEGVASFVGEDASGSFGILAGHCRTMTALSYGLARYRLGRGDWIYLAFPGAILYFVDNSLTLNCRRYLRDQDYQRISKNLLEQLLAEEEELREIKQNLDRLEQEMLRRLWHMGRGD